MKTVTSLVLRVLVLGGMLATAPACVSTTEETEEVLDEKDVEATTEEEAKKEVEEEEECANDSSDPDDDEECVTSEKVAEVPEENPPSSSLEDPVEPEIDVPPEEPTTIVEEPTPPPPPVLENPSQPTEAPQNQVWVPNNSGSRPTRVTQADLQVRCRQIGQGLQPGFVRFGCNAYKRDGQHYGIVRGWWRIVRRDGARAKTKDLNFREGGYDMAFDVLMADAAGGVYVTPGTGEAR